MKKHIYSIMSWSFMLASAVLYFTGVLQADAAGVMMAMATPAAMAGPYTEAYASLQDINMPKWYDILVEKYGDQGAEVIGMCQALGWTSDHAYQLIQHWEDDWIWDNFKVMAQGGGGATATLTIDPTSIFDGAFYPGVKDLIEFPNKDSQGNNIQARVTAIGANTIDVIVANDYWTIPATTDGEELIIITNLSAEGTGQPAPRRRQFNLYVNTFGIIKETVSWTGSEATDTLKFSNYMGDGIDGIVDLSTMELDYRMMAAEQGLFLSGFKYNNLTEAGKPVLGTEGMFPALKRAGIPYGFSIFGMSAFDTIERSLSKVYAGRITGFLAGIDIDITSENVLQDYLKHTDVDFTTKTSNKILFGDSENADGLAVSVNFSYIKKAKRTYALKRFEAMQNPKTYGATGYDYTSRAVLMPLRTDNIDPKTKAKVPTMRTLYRKKNGYSRQKEMFWTGSANAARYGVTNDIDSRELNCRSHLGAEFFAINQWVDVFPTY